MEQTKKLLWMVDVAGFTPEDNTDTSNDVLEYLKGIQNGRIFSEKINIQKAYVAVSIQ
jgi:hypothetical protein